MSQHLKAVRNAGRVESKSRGLWVLYYVLSDGLSALTAWLGQRSTQEEAA